jgi:hypothetical protein
MIKTILSITIILLLSHVGAQTNLGFKKKRGVPIYQHTRDVSRNGIHGSIGGTMTFGIPDKNTAEFGHQNKSGFGYSAEIGMIHISSLKAIKKLKFLHYVDWAIGIEDYRGTEESHFYADPGQNYNSNLLGSGTYNLGFAMARLNINSIIELSRYNFLDFSLGAHVKYQIYQNSEYTGNQFMDEPYNQNSLLAGLHFRFGFGIKMHKQWFLVPNVEIPIVTFYDWNNAKPTFQYFSSEWMPVKASLKLIYLFYQDPNKCSAKDAKGAKQSQQYQNGR